jgi:hypothetical protein
MRTPDPVPLELTLFFAIVLAIVRASFVNKSLGGAVETVFTLRTHFFVLAIAPFHLCCGFQPRVFAAVSLLSMSFEKLNRPLIIPRCLERLNVPKFLRLPVFGSCLREYNRYSPDLSFLIIANYSLRSFFMGCAGFVTEGGQLNRRNRAAVSLFCLFMSPR